MTAVETEVLDEFDLDIQIDEIDETDPPARKYDHRAESRTLVCTCSMCCPTAACTPLYGGCPPETGLLCN
jgi:hypothetical protein